MPRTTPASKPEPASIAPEASRNLPFEQESVAFFGEIVHRLGVPRSVGMIYGVLFASPVPLRFTDIADRLEISRGSASQGLHALQELGAVRVATNGSATREVFEVELGLRTLVSGILREKVSPIVSEHAVQVSRLRSAVDQAAEPVHRKFYEGRVKQIETWRRQVRLILPLLTTIVGPGSSWSRRS